MSDYEQMQKDLQAMGRRLAEAETKLARCEELAIAGDCAKILAEVFEAPAAVSEAFFERLAASEGTKLCAYMDGGGFLHIGHGTRIGPSIAGAKMPDGRLVKDVLDAEEGTWISASAAGRLMREDAYASLKRIYIDFGATWWAEIADTPRGEGVLDVYYVMGSLTEFPNMKRALRERMWHGAALELLYVDPNAPARTLTEYARQVGVRGSAVAAAIANNEWV